MLKIICGYYFFFKFCPFIVKYEFILPWIFHFLRASLKIGNRCYLNNYSNRPLQFISCPLDILYIYAHTHISPAKLPASQYSTKDELQKLAWAGCHKRKSSATARGLAVRNSNKPLAFLDNKARNCPFEHTRTLPSNYMIGALLTESLLLNGC